MSNPIPSNPSHLTLSLNLNLTNSHSHSLSTSPPSLHQTHHHNRLRLIRASYSLPWGPNIPPRPLRLASPNTISTNPIPLQPPHPLPLPAHSRFRFPPPPISSPPTSTPSLLPPPTLRKAHPSLVNSPHFPSPRPRSPGLPIQTNSEPDSLPSPPEPDDSPGSSPVPASSLCRSPLSPRSSCSSLRTLASRSPLFDDQDSSPGPLPLSPPALDLLVPPHHPSPTTTTTIQAHSWPVFDPPSPLEHGRPMCLRRSFSGSLNLLVPTPLATDEPDPLLAPPLPLPPPPIAQERTRLPRKKRRPAGQTGESLLAKSLRRLSRKLPNIQWGILTPKVSHCLESEEDVLGGLIDGGAGDDAQQQQDEEGESDGLVQEEEEAGRIARLVKSWTSDTIQPQNRLSGRFINDPEMEWSSMMVQLETFSPPSKKSSRATRPSTRPRLRHTDSTSGTSPASSPSRRRRRQPRVVETSGTVRRRVVANPLHLLQLTLELEMMRKKKIGGPLKQRAVRLIVVRQQHREHHHHQGEKVVESCVLEKSGGIIAGDRASNSGTCGSPLRYEVLSW